MNEYLLLDIGNTNIKYALVLENKFISKKTFNTSEVEGIINEEIPSNIKNIFISSVVPEVNIHFENLHINSYFVSHDNVSNIKVKIPNPKELGSDLIINASAAYELTNSRNLIIDHGTALTFCHVDYNGNYLGCLIFPGNRIASESLSKHTSQLSFTEMNDSNKLFGVNTEEAIGTGLFKGYIHLINGFIREFKDTYSDIKVVGSGKGIEIFKNHINLDIYEDNLTINGLNFFAKNILGIE